MTGYPKTKATRQISRRTTSPSTHSQVEQDNQETAQVENEPKVEPQTVLRALQSGKLQGNQRSQAIANLTGVYGNKAIQRILSATKTNSDSSALLRSPATLDAPVVAPAKAKYEDFRDDAVREKYLAKLTSAHVKSQLTPEFKNPNKKKGKGKKLTEEEVAKLRAEHEIANKGKQKENFAKMLGMGGWHLGGIHESQDGHGKVADKNGNLVTNESAEANLFDSGGEWHFGASPDKVIEFFNQIVKVNVPGDLYMHKKAAERLENIYAILEKNKKPWPETSVGQSFRGNLDHGESTASYHAHKLGFALDFRADVNPMITDGLKRRLLKAVGGGSSNVNLNRGGQKGHREAIREMGKLVGKTIAENKQKTAAGEVVAADNVTHLAQVDNFFSLREFDEEYDRVKGVSDNFVGSLTKGVIDELKDLRDSYLAQRKEPEFKALLTKAAGFKVQIAKLEKAKTKDEVALTAAKSELTAVQAELDAKTLKMRERIKVLLQPWITAVKTQRELAKIEYEQAAASQNAQQTQDAAHQKQLETDYNQKLAEAQQQIAEAKAAGKKSKVKLPTKPKAEKGADKAAKAAAEKTQDKKNELDYWIWLQDTLEVKAYNHLDFVLEKGSTKTIEVEATNSAAPVPAPVAEETSTGKAKKGKAKAAAPATPKEKKEIETGVVNPSVLQLAQRGFFNPDKEKSDRKGFDKEFVKLMLMHGFAWGATWASQDTMHFELAEEIDNMPSSLRKYNHRVD